MSESKERIWLSSPHMGQMEMHYIQEAFDTNWISPAGPNIVGFEEDLKSYTGAGNAVALSSGTAAIHLALLNLGIDRDDEVICSSFTFAASVNPVVYQGATPVFVDSELDTWNMDPVLLKETILDRISKGKKPKAIILVHLYGMPAHMDEIMQIADEFDIPVIEDAAEALGSTYKGKPLGTFGVMGILSFNGNKIITTSGGGAMISENKEYVEHARFLSTQARDQAPHYQHSHIGYNYRMSNICAGIGRGQMTVLEDRIQKRRGNFEFYKEKLESSGLFELPSEPDQYYSNRWLTTILLKTEDKDREEIRQELERYNIETRPLWKPMHLQPVFKDYPTYLNGNSESLFDKGLCLPSGSNLTEENLEMVVDKILKFFN